MGSKKERTPVINQDCKTCAWEQNNGPIDPTLGHKEAGKLVGCNEASIRRHRKHAGTVNASRPEETSETSDGTKTVTAIRTRPVTLEDARDWIKATGDNPDNYTLSIRSIAYGADMFSNRMSAVPKRAADSNEPAWPVIQQAKPVNITFNGTPATPARDGLKLALKCADTQIGYRATSEHAYEAFHDQDAMRIFINVCRQEQPDKITILGDFLDLPSQSRWAQEAGFARTTQMALDTGHEFLAALRAAAPSAEIVLIEGNHDKRMTAFIETNALAAFGLKQAGKPASWPVMSLPFLLRLEELRITYMDAYPAATDWDDDNTRNIHGTRANSKGSTMAQYANDLPHINTWAGHTHRAEVIYKTVMGARGEAIESYNANPGCLCRVDGTVPSVHGATHQDGTSARIVEDWQQGFGSLLYDGEGRSWPQVHRISGGVTIYNGRRIAA